MFLETVEDRKPNGQKKQVGDDQDAQAMGAEDREQRGIPDPRFGMRPVELADKSSAESLLCLPRSERNRVASFGSASIPAVLMYSPSQRSRWRRTGISRCLPRCGRRRVGYEDWRSELRRTHRRQRQPSGRPSSSQQSRRTPPTPARRSCPDSGDRCRLESPSAIRTQLR